MLKVLGLEQQNEWQSIVESFKDHDVYWLPGYTKAFKIHGDGEPKLFYYENGNTRAINVVMLRDIHDFEPLSAFVKPGEWFDIVTPYGYGGWLIEGENSPFEEYESYCREHNIVSEFVRFHPVIKNHLQCESFYEIIQLGKTVAMDISSPETIWGNMTPKCRNSIRKAQKSGVTVNHGNTIELFETFRSLYDRTMDKDNAEKYYYFGSDFYESIYDDLNNNAEVFYADYEGLIIAASIIMNCNGRLNYHLSGSNREFSSLNPGSLILYEAALKGSENGYRTFYLGGGLGSQESSLFKFKAAFNRDDSYLNHFFIGKKTFIPEMYSELVSMRREIFDVGYFPKYRAQ